MAKKSDIKEGAKFDVNGRIGTAYAVTKDKIERGVVDLMFQDGCLFDSKQYAPIRGLFNFKKIKLVKE
jgi:hypothetical protein